MKKLYYYKIYKPYGMLSQFTDSEGRAVLKDLFAFPNDVYSIGRLDSDSEGLLLLTSDKKLTDKLLNPKRKIEKEYYVLVERVPEKESLTKLEAGVVIEGKKTLPAKVTLIETPNLPERVPPVRVRKTVVDKWLSITITEGRNRQVRKMTAAVGHPTLRLIRVRINNIHLGSMKPGEVRELTEKELKSILE